MDNRDDQSEQPVRQIGTGMIIAGWLIALHWLHMSLTGWLAGR